MGTSLVWDMLWWYWFNAIFGPTDLKNFIKRQTWELRVTILVCLKLYLSVKFEFVNVNYVTSSCNSVVHEGFYTRTTCFSSILVYIGQYWEETSCYWSLKSETFWPKVVLKKKEKTIYTGVLKYISVWCPEIPWKYWVGSL